MIPLSLISSLQVRGSKRGLLERTCLDTGGVNPAFCPKEELNIFYLDHWTMCLDKAGSRKSLHFPDSWRKAFCFSLFHSLSNLYSFTTMAQPHQEKTVIHLSLFHSLSNVNVCEEWSSSPPVPGIFSQWLLNTNVLVALGRWAESRMSRE